MDARESCRQPKLRQKRFWTRRSDGGLLDYASLAPLVDYCPIHLMQVSSMNRMLTTFTLCLVVPIGLLEAGDWPQWRGPNRTDVSSETGLLKSWPEGGPQRVWTFDGAGKGYSGFSISAGRLFTMGAIEENGSSREYLIAVTADSGKSLWQRDVGELLTNGWGDGPRSTPTVDGDHVFALSGRGKVVCANVADGREIWSVDLKDFGGRMPNWGYCESVLVDGNQVVCTPGGNEGAVVALDRRNGEKLWQSAEFKQGAQYSSIVIAELNGKRQYIQLTQKELAGLDSQTGQVLWSTDWHGRTAVIPTPIYRDGYVYITSGYGAGCKMIHVGEGNSVEVIYDNTVMKNHHGGVVLIGDHLYGFSDGPGWTCQDFQSGEMVWNERSRFKKGAVTSADGMLYCLEENTGALALVEVNPEGWMEKGRMQLEPQSGIRSPRGKIWTHPVISNGKLYLRDQEFISCYDIKAR